MEKSEKKDKGKEKKKDKKENKSKKKGKYQEPSELVLHFTGLPGSDLRFFFSQLSSSIRTNLNDLDYTTIQYIEYSKNYNSKASTLASIGQIGIDISTLLPLEVLYALGSHLEPQDCLNLIRVNKKLNQVFNDVSIWRNFCIKSGLDRSSTSSLTVADYKKILFTEKWSFIHERIYPVKEKTYCTEVWRFVAINMENHRRNYHYDSNLVSFLVFNMAKFDSILTDMDGTQMTYLDKCKSFVKDIATRPHGPITKQQFKLANTKGSGLGTLEDYHQPTYHPNLGIFFIGEAILLERMKNENLDLVIPNGSTCFEYFKNEFLNIEGINRDAIILYPYDEAQIQFSSLFDATKDCILQRALKDTGF